MTTYKLLMAAALLGFSSASIAQNTYTDVDGNVYNFQKHFFLDVQGGAQYTLGEAKFGDLLSPNVQLGIGYQFSPVFGLRLQANGWQSKGGWVAYRKNVGDTPFSADYKFNYVAPGVDFMFNLSNLLCGWNPNRVLNATAFIGCGANVAWGNDEANEIGSNIQKLDNYNLEYLWSDTKVRPYGRAGIDLEVKVSKAVSIMLEGNVNVISDKYNSKKADNADWYFNALAGLRINLGKSYTKEAKKKVEEAPAAVPVSDVKPQSQPQPVQADQKAEEKIEQIRRDVFFRINSNIVSDAQAAKIKDVVDYLNKYPEAKVVVTGYADAGTGNDIINDRLSAKRAATVAKILKEKYGIAESRITEDSKGARVQPFADNDMNRVSILIAK